MIPMVMEDINIIFTYKFRFAKATPADNSVQNLERSLNSMLLSFQRCMAIRNEENKQDNAVNKYAVLTPKKETITPPIAAPLRRTVLVIM